MNIWITAALAAMVSQPAHPATEVAPREEQVPFDKGTDAVEIKQSIQGRLTAQYRVSAKAGQILTVDLKPSNTSAYFNITAKGADYALFNGSIMGNHFMGPVAHRRRIHGSGVPHAQRRTAQRGGELQPFVEPQPL